MMGQVTQAVGPAKRPPRLSGLFVPRSLCSVTVVWTVGVAIVSFRVTTPLATWTPS